MTAARYLHIARHGDAEPDESGLSAAGRRQAELLGDRLRSAPIATVHHGPLPRAAQTARAVAGHLADARVIESEAAGDYVPYAPSHAELPADCADFLFNFVSAAAPTEEERQQGRELARRAHGMFTGPVDGDTDRHELVVTHNFLAAWLVRDALQAPEWRWLGLNLANAALTTLRYAPGRPPDVLVLNDMRHLPAELRWTGFPVDLRSGAGW